LAVQRADLHVFDRLGLHGKIGSVRSRNRDKSCRGAEEKTLHHLHSNLQIGCHGSVEWASLEWKPPSRPHVAPGFCFSRRRMRFLPLSSSTLVRIRTRSISPAAGSAFALSPKGTSSRNQPTGRL